MSAVINKPKRKKKNDKFDKLIGPTDPKIDAKARESLITARVGLLMKSPFYGNLATRLKLINADEWCGTAATDGRNLYYNSRFVDLLRTKEVEFLVGHEVLHVVYDHLGRLGLRDAQLFNIANDYAVNADLKRHRIGEFITSVPCLYEVKYDGKTSEFIYDDLMKNVQKIDINSLIGQMMDEHLEDENESDGEDEGENSKRPRKLSEAEREELRQEIKQNIINAAKAANPGEIPKGVQRLLDQATNPTMPWRELIQTNITSTIKVDYSFARPSRRGWHTDAIMASMTPGEEIDVCVALDMSGSISAKVASQFVGEIGSMMEMFSGYRIHVFCFDTQAYAPADFNSENLDTIDEYEPKGGGGTDFGAIFDYLKERGEQTKRLIVFTDGLPFGSWGDPDFCDTTWIIHGSKDIEPPFGTHAYFD